MRLWHIDLIPYLPKSQLVGQWRELNSIFKKQDKHILINYVYDYDKEYLYYYSFIVINEMDYRGYKINKVDNFNKYFENMNHFDLNNKLKFKEHNSEYLTICYYNLKEKYLRGQKDFTKECWEKLDKFYTNRMIEEYSNIQIATSKNICKNIIHPNEKYEQNDVLKNATKKYIYKELFKNI